MYTLIKWGDRAHGPKALGAIGVVLFDLRPKSEAAICKAVKLMRDGAPSLAMKMLTTALGSGLPTPVCHEMMLLEWELAMQGLGYETEAERQALVARSRLGR